MRRAAAGVMKTVPKTPMILRREKNKPLAKGKTNKGANAGARAVEFRASKETVGNKCVGCKTGLQVNQ